MRDSALKSKTVAVSRVVHGKPGYGPIPRLLKAARNQWRELWRIGENINMNPENLWNISVLRSALKRLGHVQSLSAQIIAMHSNGIPRNVIAKKLGIGRNSIWRIITSANRAP